MKYPVIAYGELLWDMLPSGKLLGGAPSNFAFRLNNLGVPTLIISRLGKGPLGQEAIRILKEANIATDYIQTGEKHPTGIVEVELDEKGQPEYIIAKSVAYDYILPEDKQHTAANNSRIFCFGTLIQRSERSRDTLYDILDQCESPEKLLDINLRKHCFTEDIISKSLNYADILKLNDEELDYLVEIYNLSGSALADHAKSLIEKFDIKTCVVTRGANGAFAINQRGETADTSGIKVDVVDTIGSGDSFTAGFVKCYLEDLNLTECCQYANLLGALNSTTKGAMNPLDLSEITDKFNQYQANL